MQQPWLPIEFQMKKTQTEKPYLPIQSHSPDLHSPEKQKYVI